MVIHLTAGFLPAARCLATRVRPIPGTGRDCSRPDRRPGVPVWPCTAWGLSCPGSCPPGGGLLPRLFTLTARPLRAPRRFILCDTFHRPELSPRPSAGFSAACCLVVFGLSSPAEAGATIYPPPIYSISGPHPSRKCIVAAAVRRWPRPHGRGYGIRLFPRLTAAQFRVNSTPCSFAFVCL